MSEQIHPYAQTLNNTISKNTLMRFAHGVMCANKSKPEVVQENISSIRAMINNAKQKMLPKTAAALERHEKAMIKAKQAIRVQQQINKARVQEFEKAAV